MKPPAKKKPTEQGFTLTELMVVLALLAIVGLIALPSYQRMSVNANLRTAARQLASDFFSLRQAAMAENRMYRIPLEVGDNRYALQRCNNIGSVCGGYTEILAKDLAAVAADISFDAGATTVADFFIQPRGAVTNGTVVLRNNRGSTATINVNATGRTNVQFNFQ